ncbi:MAG: hypothetical protein JNL01_14300 [Bdellovibrionales bacterium]|nr:hypothetical protein [Bdellovibrionales bacterium]
MNNPNSPMNRIKRNLKERWSSEDYPGAEPRFQIILFIKDVAVFVMLPLIVSLAAKSFSGVNPAGRKPQTTARRDLYMGDHNKSQIIDFESGTRAVGREISAQYGVLRKSPGSLVRIKLMNVVETYSTAPVHAQIVDRGLGNSLMGGVLIGDANPDPAFERINISFRFARDPKRDNVAIPITARALSLDGTLGLIAAKKEGFFARSAYGSANGMAQNASGGGSNVDLKEVLFRALTSGLVQEFGKTSQVEQNRSQVLTLQPSNEFFAELTDFFPGGSK